MKLIDNQTILLGDDLRSEIKRGSKLRIAASCFSIYAFNELKKELEGVDELRFIFSSSAFADGEVTETLRKEKFDIFNSYAAASDAQLQVFLDKYLLKNKL